MTAKHPGALTLLLLAQLFTSPRVHAFLGSFEQSQGYHTSLSGGILSNQSLVDAGEFTLGGYLPTAEYNFVSLTAQAPDDRFGPDLSRYNAGQYTSDLPLDIADNSGLWQSIYGGRLVEDDFGGPWDGWGPDYAAATSAKAHTGTQSLALRASDDSLVYRYTLDSRDAPVVSSLSLSFWLNPSAQDDSFTGNVFSLTLLGADNTPWFDVGYSGDNFLQYRAAGSSSWTTTSTQFGTQGWSQLSLQINPDLGNASLGGLSYDDATGIENAIPDFIHGLTFSATSSPLMAFDWTLQGGTLDDQSLNAAHYFDDFSIAAAAVPEPGSALLIALIPLCLGLRRRR